MRKIVAIAGLLLPLAAAKPLPPEEAVVGPADTVGAWRGQAVGACIDILHAVPDLSPDNLEGICGCAATAAIGDNPGPLPPVERGRFPAAMRGRLSICTARIRPERTGDVMRLAMRASQAAPPPVMEPPPPAEAKPTDEADIVANAENGDASGGGFWEWVRSLRLPAWLTGADALLWVALGIFVFGLLILKIRGRDPRRDLSAPPSSMRRGAPPQPPRRPDMPR